MAEVTDVPLSLSSGIDDARAGRTDAIYTELKTVTEPAAPYSMDSGRILTGKSG